MAIPLETRKRVAAEIPWVKLLYKARQCDGKQGTCKVAAQWKFRALKKSWAQSGVYCWFHLFYCGLYSDMEEEARTLKWIEQHYPNGIQ